MGTKWFLLVDLKGLKDNLKGEELFLGGGLMLFGAGMPLKVVQVNH